MLEHIQTQVLGVRSEPSRDGQSIKHLVSLSGGQSASGTIYPAQEYTTFDPALEALARGYVNQGPTTVAVEIAQRPKARGSGYWINHNIEGIGNDLPPLGMPAEAGTPVQAPQAQAQPAPQQAPQPQVHPVLAEDGARRSEENRRSAVHAAAEVVSAELQAGFLPSAPEATASLKALSEAIMAFIETGSFDGPTELAVTSVETAPQQTVTPQEVAEQVPGVQVGVPFDAEPQAQPANVGP